MDVWKFRKCRDVSRVHAATHSVTRVSRLAKKKKREKEKYRFESIRLDSALNMKAGNRSNFYFLIGVFHLVVCQVLCLGHRAKYLRSIYLLAGRRYTDSHYFYLVIHSPFSKSNFTPSNYTDRDRKVARR